MARIGIRGAQSEAQGEGLKDFLYERRKVLLGCASVVGFFIFWEGIFEFVELNQLFMTKPSLIYAGMLALLESGELINDLGVSASPFFVGFFSAAIVGVLFGVVMGWRTRVGYALDPLMTAFYASPLIAIAPLMIIFFGVGIAGKAILIFVLCVFPFMFNAFAGVKSVDPLLINVVRSLGGRERDLYLKVIVPSVLPFLVAGARYAVGRGLVGVIVGEFYAATAGIGYRIIWFGDMYELGHMFVCIITVMLIAVVFTEGIRWAERAAFPWRVGE
jgi:NitT/TauT family transport system permease protein